MNKILKNKTILYAEDSIPVQDQYARYFKNIFKEVYLAADGQEALNIFFEKKPDVAILDINMPKIDGLALTNIINKEDPNTPVILLTARSDKETLKNAIELNLLTYLEKPVSRDDLFTAINKLEIIFTDNQMKLWTAESGGPYFWDREKYLLYKDDEKVSLTKQESLLLKLLIESNKICSYQDIYEYVWQDHDKEYNESTIKTIISTLKTKLPKNAILNERGVGYYIDFS